MFTEKDLEEYLLDYDVWSAAVGYNSNRKTISHLNQVSCGGYGIADIVTIKQDLLTSVHVSELKITNFRLEHVLQLARYMAFFKQGGCKVVRGYLFATGIDAAFSKGDDVFLCAQLGSINFIECSYDFGTGVTFENIVPDGFTLSCETKESCAGKINSLMDEKGLLYGESAG